MSTPRRLPPTRRSSGWAPGHVREQSGNGGRLLIRKICEVDVHEALTGRAPDNIEHFIVILGGVSVFAAIHTDAAHGLKRSPLSHSIHDAVKGNHQVGAEELVEDLLNFRFWLWRVTTTARKASLTSDPESNPTRIEASTS